MIALAFRVFAEIEFSRVSPRRMRHSGTSSGRTTRYSSAIILRHCECEACHWRSVRVMGWTSPVFDTASSCQTDLSFSVGVSETSHRGRPKRVLQPLPSILQRTSTRWPSSMAVVGLSSIALFVCSSSATSPIATSTGWSWTPATRRITRSPSGRPGNRSHSLAGPIRSLLHSSQQVRLRAGQQARPRLLRGAARPPPFGQPATRLSKKLHLQAFKLAH